MSPPRLVLHTPEKKRFHSLTYFIGLVQPRVVKHSWLRIQMNAPPKSPRTSSKSDPVMLASASAAADRAELTEAEALRKQFFANDSLGG